MTTDSNYKAFDCLIDIPFVGDALVMRESRRHEALPFSFVRIERREQYLNELGELMPSFGEINGVTVQIGRWHAAVGRPYVGSRNKSMRAISDTALLKMLFEGGPEPLPSPMSWNQTAWIVLAAPPLLLLGTVACIGTGLFSHLIGSRLRRQLSWR